MQEDDLGSVRGEPTREHIRRDIRGAATAVSFVVTIVVIERTPIGVDLRADKIHLGMSLVGQAVPENRTPTTGCGNRVPHGHNGQNPVAVRVCVESFGGIRVIARRRRVDYGGFFAFRFGIRIGVRVCVCVCIRVRI